MTKLPISAMVVGFNEGKYLKPCLESISFCEEIIYTDLGSTDNSIDIALPLTSTINYKKKADVPAGEIVFAELVHHLKHDWVIFIDPDERLDESLANEIQAKFHEFIMDERLGALLVPWQFYFNKYRLQGTIWGGNRTKFFLVNRKRFLFNPIIHYGRIIKPGFSMLEIPLRDTENVLHHYWMNSYSIFWKKHSRYLIYEGKDQFDAGRRVGIKEVFFKPFSSFKESFFLNKGYKDLNIGFLLSVFWAYYQTRIAIDILKLQSSFRLVNDKSD